MSSSNERGLNYESVAAACELFVANGYQPEKISLRDIRGETAGGSLTTIQKYRERWLRERRGSTIELVQIDDSEMDGLRAFVAQLVSQKTSDMRAEFEVGAAAYRAVIERLELDIDEALKSNDQLHKQSQEAVSRAYLLEHDVLAANLRADELVAANANLRNADRNRLVDERPAQAIPPEIVQDIGAHPPADSGEETAT